MIDKPPFKVDCVVGTRPNFVKIAPVVQAFRARDDVLTRLIHTGQHYDILMDKIFFEELRIPTPDNNLKIGSGRPADQIARIMLGLEPVFLSDRPDLLVVVGDVHSTVAAAMTASAMGIPIAHVEAGLRSGDRAMPEEINRLVVDQLSDLHFVSEPSGVDHLIAENVARGGITLTGNVMIDTLLACLDRAIPPDQTFTAAGMTAAFIAATRAKGFALVTLHRPANVDDPAKLTAFLQAFVRVARSLPVVFAIHPRTRARIARFGLQTLLDAPFFATTEPLTYLSALGLMRDAKVVLTDSGGIQEETTALGVPCITVRDNTERPITVEAGTNILIGSNPEAIENAVAEVLSKGEKQRVRLPPLWDGKAAERIVDAAVAFLNTASRTEGARRG